MIKIKEIKNKNEIKFIKEYWIDNSLAHSENIYYSVKKTKTGSGAIQYLIYDNNMIPRFEAWNFINIVHRNMSENTKLKDVSALKLLFSFEDMIDKKIDEFQDSDIDGFIDFLQGRLLQGNLFWFDLVTKRSASTVNDCLGVCRSYLKSMNKDNKYLSEVDSRDVAKRRNYSENNKQEKNKKNLKEFSFRELEISHYIRKEEYIRILQIIRQSDKDPVEKLKAELIVRLQYQYGLRIGEVLGLTREDVVIEKIMSSKGTYESAYFLYLRNRVSDNPYYQQAKGCLSVKIKSDYSLPDYNTEGNGYQKVQIHKSFYEKIISYFEILIEKFAGNTKFYNGKADSVIPVKDDYTGDIYYVEDNDYLFHNNWGAVLTQDAWKYNLRKIYIAAGIEVDFGKRQFGLNHRLRHGFAMCLVIEHRREAEKLKSQGEKPSVYKEEDLSKRLRQTNSASAAHYFRPTFADRLELKQAFEDSRSDPLMPFME